MTGLSKEDQMVFHFLWSVFMPAVCLVGLLSNYRNWKVYGMILLSGVLVKRMLIVLFKKRRKLEFNKNAYRLYKFLHNQISAGVQPKESMASLYRIVKEPFLRERLQALGSMYSQTLDFEMSFNEISTYYEGADVNSFKIAIAQGISLGNNLTTLKKQEELMFSKYMNYLQLETNRQKAKTFFVVSIYCMIIILMIGLPLMMELAEALDMIFMR
jgi:Flp pilus assembly protein TadB